jgi:ketosteroid isomerase-like protein
LQSDPDGAEKERGRALKRDVFAIAQFRMEGAIDAMMRYFSPDVVVRYHGAKEGLFLPGELHGVEAFKENIRLTDIEYEPLGFEVLDILVDGETAAIRWRNSWRQRGTGRITTLDMAHFLRWRDGSVVELFEYLDYHGWGPAADEARLDKCEPGHP